MPIKRSPSTTPQDDLTPPPPLGTDLIISSAIPTTPEKTTSPGKASRTSTPRKKAKPSPPMPSPGLNDVKPEMDDLIDDESKPNTGKNAKAAKTGKTTPKKTAAGGVAVGSSPVNGPWTIERKLQFAEIVVSRGLAAIPAEELANELGVTKQQIRDATQKGKKNLRARLIAAAEGI